MQTPDLCVAILYIKKSVLKIKSIHLTYIPLQKALAVGLSCLNLKNGVRGLDMVLNK